MNPVKICKIRICEENPDSIKSKRYFKICACVTSQFYDISNRESHTYYIEFTDEMEKRLKNASMYENCGEPVWLMKFECAFKTYNLFCLDFKNNVYLRIPENEYGDSELKVFRDSTQANVVGDLCGPDEGRGFREYYWWAIFVKAIDERENK